MKRRKFLISSAMGAAGLGLTACESGKQGSPAGEIESESFPVPAYKSGQLAAGTPSMGANDKIVLALIGAGGWGSNHAIEFSNLKANVEFKYICDVDDTRGGRAIAECGKIQGYEPQRVRDMRTVFDDNDVDGVIIATPTHWHTLAALRAMQAGKDVYLEKCITLNVSEGQKLVAAAQKYNRVLQCGFQNRSAEYNRKAVEYIQSGKLGKIMNVSIFGYQLGPVPFNEKPEESAPDTIDWNLWLGPAPEAAYSVSRNKSWLYYWDYSAGILMEDAVHQMDLARYVLGNPGLPKSVTAIGGRQMMNDNREIPDNLNVIYEYDDFTMNLLAGEFCQYLIKASPEIRYGDLFPDWMTNSDKIFIYGSEAMMILGRMGAGWQVIGKDGKVVDQMYGRFPLNDNQRNYLDCIRSRQVPNANILHGHLSSAMLHYANMSIRLGNKRLMIDQQSEFVQNDPDANKIVRGNYREGFELPVIA
ncbi:MAG TPA: Gfo/Idh/MocA family oxidoreductase [Cyclobacteriaceae bacterium]|nr:Gfo/Idh/MocA family oxidoreductase [Cyclobacteriaceae bacterium]